eukprot:42102-Eustigmatos_ZCMA.PRE.1
MPADYAHRLLQHRKHIKAACHDQGCSICGLSPRTTPRRSKWVKSSSCSCTSGPRIGTEYGI